MGCKFFLSYVWVKFIVKYFPTSSFLRYTSTNITMLRMKSTDIRIMHGYGYTYVVKDSANGRVGTIC